MKDEVQVINCAIEQGLPGVGIGWPAHLLIWSQLLVAVDGSP